MSCFREKGKMPMIKAPKLALPPAVAYHRRRSAQVLRLRQDEEIAEAEYEMRSDPAYNFGEPWPLPSETEARGVSDGEWRWADNGASAGGLPSSLCFLKSALRRRYARVTWRH